MFFDAEYETGGGNEGLIPNQGSKLKGEITMESKSKLEPAQMVAGNL